MARFPASLCFTPCTSTTSAKYVTETGQPATFAMVEISKKWYDSLPADLQQILDKDAAAELVAINPWAVEFNDKARKAWVASGGELISFRPTSSRRCSKSWRVSATKCRAPKPQLNAAYQNSHGGGAMNAISMPAGDLMSRAAGRMKFSLSGDQLSSNVGDGFAVGPGVYRVRQSAK